MRHLALLFASLTAFGQPHMTVHLTDDLMRVRPGDPPESFRPLALKAARNEYAPFQVVVRAGEEGLRNVHVTMSELRGENDQLIPARRLTLFREHYVEVTKPSPKSKEGAGWYPDALIPFLDTLIEKARFVAAPFDVPPDSNQPLWVDVFVPPDAAPGPYTGTITVTARDHDRVRVPIELTVWDFRLPDTPSLRSSFGSLSGRVASWYKLEMNSEEFRELERQFAEVLAAHRLNAPIPAYLRPKVNPDGSIDSAGTHAGLKDWIERFRITGFPIPLLGSDPLGKDRERNARYLRAMYEYLRENGWEKLAYIYVLDEPNTAEAYEQVRQRARFIHETQPGIKVLCTEQPTPSNADWGTLVGSVDIWVPLWFLFDEKAGAERLAAGDELWSYTALCQGPKGRETPFWQLDFPPLNYRIPAWISWRFGMTGLLYWTTVYWDSAIDLWTTPLSFRQAYNYEGLLLFPASEAGFRGFVPSVRLKQVREGFEDYEYLKLLAEAGNSQAADEVVAGLGRSWTDWDDDPAHLYAARERLAELILKAP